jgi:hypothetical protein
MRWDFYSCLKCTLGTRGSTQIQKSKKKPKRKEVQSVCRCKGKKQGTDHHDRSEGEVRFMGKLEGGKNGSFRAPLRAHRLPLVFAFGFLDAVSL